MAGLVTIAACGGSDGTADGGDFTISSVEPARQDVSDAEPSSEALVTETTSTTSTTTTTTTTTSTSTTTTTTAPPAGDVGGSAAPNGNEVAFEAGPVHEVGTGIVPGVYVAQAGEGFCSWTRTSSAGELHDGIYRGQIVVEILASDTRFESDVDCGTWEPYVIPTAAAATIGEGHWAVGQQIQPGTYETDQDEFDFCYWERSTGFTQTTDEIITNAIVMEGTRVQILASDARFASSGCGTWTLVS